MSYIKSWSEYTAVRCRYLVLGTKTFTVGVDSSELCFLDSATIPAFTAPVCLRFFILYVARISIWWHLQQKAEESVRELP